MEDSPIGNDRALNSSLAATTMKNAKTDPVRIAPQPVAVDESCTSGRPNGPAPDSMAPTDVPATEKEDVDMGQTDVYLYNAPALPKHPTFKGPRRNAPDNGPYRGAKPFVMSVNVCIDPDSKHRIAEWDIGKDPCGVDPRALDTLKKRIKAAVVFVMSVHDADSRIGNMLDGLAAAIRRDRREWVIKEESPAIVKIITAAVKPVSLHRAVTE
ncbi:hypothetical protein H257_13085 [Aphanomyces astaci]|uniref:Uncharacterized protein n=1 Tax=Aphanomyces astaci TaxID=112090 RepID=W4FVS9_APHAT|nr:hypothetical protein H257_13085 [Aphanomyces astaci]ETV71625.1 hypothetical protein H257_13085 [Aphanomyces astaci]|eukprot:XP_009838813.1 hypothetical protein H257_13085 [Aphanomyces astaci]